MYFTAEEKDVDVYKRQIGDSINRMIPPLIASRKDVDRLVGKMREAIEEAAETLQAA